MADFVKGPNYRTPFGKNVFLRSTRDVKTESYTCAKASVVAEDIDGFDQKVLQTGEVIARITSGDDEDSVGPFQAGVSDGRQTAANIVGLNNTFLPWQLNERDVEIAVVVEARAVQHRCTERDAAGARVALDDTTAADLQNKKDLSILFAVGADEDVGFG